MSILENIQNHTDLLRLTDTDRETLCSEIRGFLVENISKTGGHLASNLGVVELTVAVETVYNTEKDRLVFDVGHQSYVHKMLTGRQADFGSLRTFGGMAGFPKPSESDTDAFIAGHASSSISIALGMARARTLLKEDRHIVVMIGDGAATGGMVYEGINDLAESKEPMVIILNDNEMSIQKNVGGLARQLSKLRTKSKYLGVKKKYRSLMNKIPGGKWLYRLSHKTKDVFRRLFLPATLFENMGLTYFGPVDGHDLPNLISVLQSAKELGGPVIVHVHTQKGKGYAPAEEQPSKFHGIGCFNPENGIVVSGNKGSFSKTFGETMLSLAQEQPNICAITAAMPEGTGLLGFKEKYPDRLFDVGIAEEHAVSMAGGLAKQGMVPVVAIYSTFLQRAYDMLLQDIALLGLHVVFAIDRAGLVGEDGETHHGVFDVGFLRQIPGMRVLCPVSYQELEQMLRWAVTEAKGPVAVRYPRGAQRGVNTEPGSDGIQVYRDGKDVALVTYGSVTKQVIDAAELLEQDGISAKVIRMKIVSPVPADALVQALDGVEDVVFVEETMVGSGVKEAFAWEISELGCNCRVYGLDLGRSFVTHGAVDKLLQCHGMDPESIRKYVKGVIRREN